MEALLDADLHFDVLLRVWGAVADLYDDLAFFFEGGQEFAFDEDAYVVGDGEVSAVVGFVLFFDVGEVKGYGGLCLVDCSGVVVVLLVVT